MNQFLWRAFCGNKVKPAARSHGGRQIQNAVRNRIASAEIVEKPARDFGGAQIGLDFGQLKTHECTTCSIGGKLHTSCCVSASICAVVTPEISMRFVRLRSPDKILTADLGLFKRPARNSHRARFARSSTAGACNRILSAVPMTPASSVLLARGCTRTANETALRSGCACKSSSATARASRRLDEAKFRAFQTGPCRCAPRLRPLVLRLQNRVTSPSIGRAIFRRGVFAIRLAWCAGQRNTDEVYRRRSEMAGCTSSPEDRADPG